MSDHRSQSSGGQQATDVATQEGQRVKGTATDAASNVGDTAATHGRELKGQAREHARSIAGGAQRQLRGHAEEETQRAGAALGTAGDQLRALADGRIDESGVLGTYVETAADAVNRWADTVQDRGLDGLLDDLRSFGRRRPGMFLAGALAAGVVAGRFGRNAAQELGDDDRSTGGDSRAPLPEGSSNDADSSDDRDSTAWRPTSGLVDAGDDLIVGYASDDSDVVVTPGRAPADDAHADDRPVAPPREDGDVEYRSIDVDQGRSR